MTVGDLLDTPVRPDGEALVECIMRRGTPSRVHHIELFLDREVQEEICRVFGIDRDLERSDPLYRYRREVALQRFLGYDYVRVGAEGLDMPMRRSAAPDTAALQRAGGAREFIDERRGPVTTWEEFERYPWPDPSAMRTEALEWYERNLPDDMCIIGGGGFAHFAEYLTWLMGYETLCYSLYDQPDLVEAIVERLTTMFTATLRRFLEFDRVKVVWGSDDMGYRGGTLLSPEDMRRLVLPGHKLMARMSHEAGRPYILHSCGNLQEIMEDLIDDVGIDGKHSYEDTIEQVTERKRDYGDRIAILGGIDVDFLCRADEQAIRRRVRETLEVCMPGGGYCLGTGNSVANYIPVRSYLVMLDEGRRFAA